MNNTRELNTYSSPSSPSTNQNIDGAMTGFLTFWALYVIVGLVIFVIWVWSMISMINLNERFKLFFEEYMRRESISNQQGQDVPIIRKELVVEPLERNANDQGKISWLTKKPGLTSIVILVVLCMVLIGVLMFVRA